MAVIAGIGTREYYRASGYELEDSYMVKNLTVVGLHAGRPDLLADQPKQLLIEYQDLQRAGAQLLLPLPPKASLKKRRDKQGNKGRGKAKGKAGAEETGEDAATVVSSEETRERARAFLTEYTTNVEPIDVPALLHRLKDKENAHLDAPGSPVPFTDKDTFAQYCNMYASLQKTQSPTASNRSALSALRLRLATWRFGANTDACRMSTLLAAATVATVAGVATVFLWIAARRRQ